MISKYNNKRLNTQDGWFDSHAEFTRWQELKLLEKAGEIRSLQRQVRFTLIPKCGRLREIVYIADFVYEKAPDWKQVVEDKKGFRSKVYMLKWRLMQFRHGIEILET